MCTNIHFGYWRVNAGAEDKEGTMEEAGGQEGLAERKLGVE